MKGLKDEADRAAPQHPGSVYVFNSEVGGNIVAWHSTDHAATFRGPVPVTGGANSQAALTLGSRPLFDPGDDVVARDAPQRYLGLWLSACIAGRAIHELELCDAAAACLHPQE